VTAKIWIDALFMNLTDLQVLFEALTKATIDTEPAAA
jgi:hypothetical protein